ncbi:MAG: cryptochrome/photolyase family protein [Planctomycetaceae bacterium]|nr:MAG: cryptochrome/photolyase family protein [Planctomycetaceae bacterium]
MKKVTQIRSLYLVLGDQLTFDSSFFKDFDPSKDSLWMAEVKEESTHVWTHKARIVMFLSAMRHFKEELETKGIPLSYTEMTLKSPSTSLSLELSKFLKSTKCTSVKVRKPGEHRVETFLIQAVSENGLILEIFEDDHFLSSIKDFALYAKDRKQIRMEYFYREMRKKYKILCDDDEPEGGEWNYDSENRKSFSKDGPGLIPTPIAFPPDKITKQVIKLANEIFKDHPGDLVSFDWPVTASQAEETLIDFLDNRLNQFGDYQDAMWMNQPWLYHSRLAAAMNLHILHPFKVITQAEDYFKSGKAPLAAVEGFIRQILGWREYVRGIYWLYMPQYLERNTLNANHDLPAFFWTANTDLNCLNQAIGQTLKHGYAHHIQRLMITGLFCLLYGVKPTQVHEWYLAVYVDAVEWVELPNSLGMSQYADGGVMASKPYIASGKYIDRMGNYCKKCKYDPAKSVGEDACPFTTMYWDFLMRHEKLLSANPRMGMQVRNLNRLSDNTKEDIKSQANAFRLSLKMI